MRNRLVKIGIVLVIILVISINIIPSMANVFVKKNYEEIITIPGGDGTEFWALIFAVGIYKNNPFQNRDFMIKDAEDLNNALLKSPQWKDENIHMVTGSNATGKRLLKELRWLINNCDRNDMTFIYITTHGSPLIGITGELVDLPPKDEADGTDEMLVMYDGFDKWYAFIWDDLLNFHLSLLRSKGVCLVVDSCYSGGFNDTPMFMDVNLKNYDANSFKVGLAEDLLGQNRIVLMSSTEYELSYGSYFTYFLIEGLLDGADFWGNYDGINSAEESFNYSEYWMEKFDVENTPTIYDLYPGEFPITYSDLNWR